MSRAFLSCRPQPRRLMRMVQCKHGADVSALPSLTVARQPSRLDRQQVRHATDQPPHLEDHFAGPDQLLARLDVGGRIMRRMSTCAPPHGAGTGKGSRSATP